MLPLHKAHLVLSVCVCVCVCVQKYELQFIECWKYNVRVCFSVHKGVCVCVCVCVGVCACASNSSLVYPFCQLAPWEPRSCNSNLQGGGGGGGGGGGRAREVQERRRRRRKGSKVWFVWRGNFSTPCQTEGLSSSCSVHQQAPAPLLPPPLLPVDACKPPALDTKASLALAFFFFFFFFFLNSVETLSALCRLLRNRLGCVFSQTKQSINHPHRQRKMWSPYVTRRPIHRISISINVPFASALSAVIDCSWKHSPSCKESGALHPGEAYPDLEPPPLPPESELCEPGAVMFEHARISTALPRQRGLMQETLS